MAGPIDQVCMHVPTPEEHDRDPEYRGCYAAPGETCTWAKRYDGFTDPEFHSERIEIAAEGGTVTVDAAQAALDLGLV